LLLPHSQQSRPLGSQQQLMAQIHTQPIQLQWCVLNPKSMNPKATQTNKKHKKKQNAKGNPFFELTGSERRRFNRRHWMARQMAATAGR